MIFEIFNTMEVQISISWLIVPCSLVRRYRCLVDAAAKILRVEILKMDASGSVEKVNSCLRQKYGVVAQKKTQSEVNLHTIRFFCKCLTR
jgi:hypothetical protein